MLQTLSVKNVALIKNLTLDFGKGFNVLLGETGAGKSIIFDALNFVLGGKADKDLIRSGENFMKVDALFGELSQNVLAAFEANGIECEYGEIVLSRQLTLDGKSTIRINGEPAVGSMLKKVGQILVDSYSQHESLDLMKNKNHLAMLDKFGGQALRELKQEVADRFARYQDTLSQIKELGGDAIERERTKSLLEYQITEIEEANLHVGEEEEVKERLALLSNAEKLCEGISVCTQLLENGSSSAIANVHEAANALGNTSGFEVIEDCKNRLASCKYELQDINETLENFVNDINFNEFELEKLDKRNDQIKLLKKKYGSDIESILSYVQDAREKFNKLSDAEFEIERLEKLKVMQEETLRNVCESLTAKRKETAKVIEAKVVKELAELGMKNTTFMVEFDKLSSYTSNGNDSVEFTFSANKGQEVKALSKTASGGEMSRFMLAIKNIFAEFGTAETLVFDEIDAGIGGETGVVVGEKIARLSKNNQVICITHLPQVACFGDNFFFVSKVVENDTTVTHLEKLEDEKIIYQLARMIGGDNVTETALKHAQEMRSRAK